MRVLVPALLVALAGCAAPAEIAPGPRPPIDSSDGFAVLSAYTDVQGGGLLELHPSGVFTRHYRLYLPPYRFTVRVVRLPPGRYRFDKVGWDAGAGLIWGRVDSAGDASLGEVVVEAGAVSFAPTAFISRGRGIVFVSGHLVPEPVVLSMRNPSLAAIRVVEAEYPWLLTSLRILESREHPDPYPGFYVKERTAGGPPP